MASSRKRHSDEEWLQHRAEIQRMFLNESASLSKIMRKLEENGFPATKSQLEYKLKVWGLRRRIPKNKTEMLWQFVDGRLSIREKQGKLSEVIHDGKVIAPAKVRKERSRYQTTSLVKYQQGLPSPHTPPGINITVCTPEPRPMEFVWPRSLPWLEFQAKFPQIFRPRGSYTRIGSPSSPSNFFSGHPVLNIFGFSGSRDKLNIALLTASLASMMPEGKEGDNINMSQALLEAPTRVTMPEYYKLIIYRISNNLEYVTRERLSHWSWIVDVLENSSIMGSRLPLEENSGPTMKAFSEKLFQSAMLMIERISHPDSWEFSSGSSDPGSAESETGQDFLERQKSELTRTKNVALWLLSSGQDPNVRVLRKQFYHTRVSTPLQLAMLNDEPNFALQLMDAGADPKISYTGFSEALEDCVRLSGLDAYKLLPVLRRFADSGLSLNEEPGLGGCSALMRAVQSRDLTWSDILVQCGADVLWSTELSYANSLNDTPVRKISILGCAAAIPDETEAMKLIRLLTDHAHSTYPSTPLAQFFEVDFVLNASLRGHSSVLDFLHEIEYDIAGAESGGLTALHIAAYLGHYGVCKSLLNYGSLVDGSRPSNKFPAPIILAAFSRHVDIVKLLHCAGADLNTSLDFEVNDCSWITWRWEAYDIGWQFARNLHHLGDCSINPVGAAILRSNWDNPRSNWDNPRSNWDNPTYKYLAKHCAVLPEWAAYHGAYAYKQLGLIKIALRESATVNVNWRGRGKETLLQILLLPALGLGNSEIRPSTTDHVVGLCFEILGAGAVLMGDEAQRAILLGNWNLVETILRRFFDENIQNNYVMSLLEAAFLSGSDCMIKHAFERNLEAYDDSALCAAVLFASKHKSLEHLQRLLRNRHKFEFPSLLEGTAVGLAVWRADMEVLRTLCCHFGRPFAALCPDTYLEQCSGFHYDFHWVEEAHSFPIRKSSRLPFWHRKDLQLIDPLFFILQSPGSPEKLRKLGFQADKHSIHIAFDMDKEEVLEIQLIPNRKQDHEDSMDVTTSSGDLDHGEKDPNSSYMDIYGGRSLLQQAVEDGSFERVKSLLLGSTEVNAPAATNSGATALQLAAITGRIGIAKMLIGWGADVDAPRALRNGRTALEGAAEHGRIDMIHFLLSMGVETGGKGRLQYMRAIKFAESEGHSVAANMLRGYRDWTDDDDNLWSELEQTISLWQHYGVITCCLMKGIEVKWIDG